MSLKLLQIHKRASRLAMYLLGKIVQGIILSV